jgi:hypothetical protein
MNDFTLPVIKKTNSGKRILSMEEYLKFVEFNIKYTLDKKSHWKWKKKLAVNVPFRIS